MENFYAELSRDFEKSRGFPRLKNYRPQMGYIYHRLTQIKSQRLCAIVSTFNFQFSTFNLKKMKRRDLAKMYFPEMSDVEAVRSLRRWIEGCPKLMSALEELSMPFKKSRNLSARQVRIIMEYLGDP